jgi:hypothetical protein
MLEFAASIPTRARGGFEVSDIVLEYGSTLRLGLEYDARGRPRMLHMALGVGEGREWRETVGTGLALPPDRIGPLIRALIPYLDRVR